VICISGQILFGDTIKTRKAGHAACIGDRKKMDTEVGLENLKERGRSETYACMGE
jgi:hypothetical protein